MTSPNRVCDIAIGLKRSRALLAIELITLGGALWAAFQLPGTPPRAIALLTCLIVALWRLWVSLRARFPVQLSLNSGHELMWREAGGEVRSARIRHAGVFAGQSIVVLSVVWDRGGGCETVWIAADSLRNPELWRRFLLLLRWGAIKIQTKAEATWL